jgi:hypothetical protein
METVGSRFRMRSTKLSSSVCGDSPSTMTSASCTRAYSAAFFHVVGPQHGEIAAR